MAITRLGPGGYPIIAAGSQLVKVYGETVRVVESLSTFRPIIRMVNELVQIVEGLIPSRVRPVTVSETVRINEVYNQTIGVIRILSETVRSLESVAQTLGLTRTFNEIVNSLESMALAFGFVRMVNEVEQVVESLAKAMVLIRATTEQIKPPEVRNQTVGITRNLSEIEQVRGANPPPFTTVRNTSAYADDLSGKWTSFPINTLRVTDKGVLIEDNKTNSIRNNSMQGAVPGTPGTLPTFWLTSGLNGLTMSVVGTGVLNGIDYIDLDFSGTASASAAVFVSMETTNIIPANVGHTWAISMFLALVSGSMPNPFLEMRTYDSGLTLIGDATSAGLPITANLTRYSLVTTLTNSATAWIRPDVAFQLVGGNAYSFRLRIGWPQLEDCLVGTGTASAVVVNGGTGGTYAVNDILTVVGGTGTATQLKVTAVSAGQVTTVSINNAGAYTNAATGYPVSPVSVTGGGGTGATFTLTPVAVVGGATSPIRTTNAAVVRQRDTTSALPITFSGTSITYFAQYLEPPDALGRGFLSGNSTTTPTVDRDLLFLNSNTAGASGVTLSNNVNQGRIDNGTYSAGALRRAVYAVAPGDRALSVNGLAPGKSTTSTRPLNFTNPNIFVGQDGNNGGQPNTFIQKIAVYGSRLSDADMQLLSSGGYVPGAILEYSFIETPVVVLGLNRLFADNVQVRETIARSTALTALVSETVRIIESTNIFRALTQSFSETVRILESSAIARGITRLASEVVRINESFAIGRTLVQLANETVRVIESSAIARAVVRATSETIQILESFATARTRVVLLTETERINETTDHTTGLIRQLVEQVRISEVTNRVLGLVRVLNETVRVVENAMQSIASDVSRVINETVRISENAFQVLLPEITKVVNEVVNIVESLSTFRPLIRIVNEVERIVESLLPTKVISRSIAETVRIIESLNSTELLTRAINETERVVESIANTVGITRTVNEVKQAIESLATALGISRMANENVQIRPGGMFPSNTMTTARGGTLAYYADDLSGNWLPFLANIPRITDRGLLIEDTRTNVVRNNSMQGAVVGSPGTLPTNWAQSQNTGITPQVVGKGTDTNGMDYIDIQLTGTTAGGTNNNLFFDTVNASGANAASGQYWTGSLFYKLVGGSLANVGGMRIYVQTTDGTVTIESFVSVITPATGSWQRATIAALLANASSTFARLAFQVTPNAAPVAIDLTLRIGWPQLERGGAATSPIRTTTVSVQRPVDNIGVSPLPMLAGTVPVSIYVQWRVNYDNPQSTFPGAITFNDTTNNNRMQLYTQTLDDTVRLGSLVGGTNQFAITAGGAFVYGNRLRAAGRFATADSALSVNGSAVAKSAVGSLPPWTVINIGALTPGSNTTGGWIERVKIYNGALTDAQLQLLSAGGDVPGAVLDYSFVDNPLALLELNRLLAETERLNEAVNETQLLTRVINEVKQTIESTLSVLTSVRVINEVVRITESLLEFEFLNRVINETERIVENIVTSLPLIRITDEMVRISEVAGQVLGIIKMVNETLQISEAVAALRGLFRNIAETVRINESSVKAQALNRMMNEVERINETTTKSSPLIRITNELIRISEAIIPTRAVVRLFSETVRIVESLSIATGLIKMINEVVCISEVMDRFLGLTRFWDGIVTIHESQATTLARVRVIAERVNIKEITDNVRGLAFAVDEGIRVLETYLYSRVLLRVRNEPVDIVETTTTSRGLFRNIAETLHVEEFVNLIASIPSLVCSCIRIYAYFAAEARIAPEVMGATAIVPALGDSGTELTPAIDDVNLILTPEVEAAVSIVPELDGQLQIEECEDCD